MRDHDVILLLLCDARGAVTEVLRDDDHLCDALSPGLSVAAVVDRENFSRCLQFLSTVQTAGAAMGWQMSVRSGTTVHLSAGQTADGILVVGTRTPPDAERLQDELLRMTNEQGTQLRRALKELVEAQTGRATRDEQLYEELSHLNNELATAQRQLAQKNHELESANALKNLFLGMAAHDLRNPLQIIVTYAAFLHDESPLQPEQDDIVTAIRRSAGFMLDLVDNLLDVSRIESGKLELDRRPVDLAALLTSVAAGQRLLAEAAEVRISTELVALSVQADEARLEQVMTNLLSNAVKFSPPGGNVVLSLERAEGCAVIEVRDEGPGIPPTDVERLFQPFSKLSTDRNKKGTGLGLLIVHKIVSAHGGTVDVRNHDGRPGCTFRVVLPL